MERNSGRRGNPRTPADALEEAACDLAPPTAALIDPHVAFDWVLDPDAHDCIDGKSYCYVVYRDQAERRRG